MGSALPLTAFGLCLLTGAAAVLLRSRAWPSWCFFVGMVLLAAERWLDLQLVQAVGEAQIEQRMLRSMYIKSALPVVWLVFSLVYARGNRREFLWRWKWVLAAALIIPVGVLWGFPGQLIELVEEDGGVTLSFLPAGKAWVLVVLLLTLGILGNLEKTFRSSVGMTRWRIKYLFLGMAMIFGVQIYILSQALLFSAYHPALTQLATAGAILGCLMIAIGHVRSGFGDFDLYPSRAVLQGSLTVILAGGYFIIIGVLAQVVAMLGGAAAFPAQAMIVLLGLVGLTVLLLSERFRNGLQRFVSRHFKRAQHDFRKIWTDFTRRTSNEFEPEVLGENAGKVIAENFHILGVSVFAATLDPPELGLLSSTEKLHGGGTLRFQRSWQEDLAARGRPFNLDSEKAAWADVLREQCPQKFGHGGDRLVVPLVAAEQLVGVVVLADRVNGVSYSHEELDLLGCIGDQLAAALLNCTLTEKVLQARELEAFQTLSTFFVHDLKNAANSLNLTLQNLPIHFDDPEFREDAIRAVGSTVERINQMILKLGSLRHELQLRREPCRLDLLCAEVLDGLDAEMAAGGRIERALEPLPERNLDKEALRSVVTNLVVNARESMNGKGTVRVATCHENGHIMLTVADEGSGMSQEFIRSELYRPFHSTKTKGLGIGMFQCKKIVEGHQGSIRVESSPGSGTSITISLPLETGS